MTLPRNTALASLLATTLLCVASISCGPRPIPPPDDALNEPEEVVAAATARLEPLQAARIRAVVEYFGEEGRVRVRQAVLAKRPAALRVETLSPFDSTLSVLVTNDELLALYDVQAELFLVGEPSARNLARLLPLWLTPRDAVAVLLGGLPLDGTVDDPDAWSLGWDERAGAYSVTMPRLDGGRVALLVRHGDWALAGARQFDAEGELLFELRAGDFERIDAREGGASAVVPRRIRFLMDRQSIDISLDVERYELNPLLPAPLFELEPPRGVEIREL